MGVYVMVGTAGEQGVDLYSEGAYRQTVQMSGRYQDVGAGR